MILSRAEGRMVRGGGSRQNVPTQRTQRGMHIWLPPKIKKKKHTNDLFFVTQEECQNYIRVLAMKSPGRLLLCGTHAYKPMCREYAYKVNKEEDENKTSLRGLVALASVVTVDTLRPLRVRE